MKYQTSLLAFALLLVIRVSADEAAAQSAGQFSINASRVPGARIKKSISYPIYNRKNNVAPTIRWSIWLLLMFSIYKKEC